MFKLECQLISGTRHCFAGTGVIFLVGGRFFEELIG